MTDSFDPVTMNLDESMAEYDSESFIKAMHKYFEGHINRKHWKIIPSKYLPRGQVPFPMVWYMKIKINIIVDIKRRKERLCDGVHR